VQGVSTSVYNSHKQVLIPETGQVQLETLRLQGKHRIYIWCPHRPGIHVYNVYVCV